MRHPSSRLGGRWCSAALAATLAWLQCVPPTAAAQFSVFRKTYVRDTSAPDTVTDAFPVLNPTTTWTLRAVNGSLEDSAVARVSSATVTLNGIEVLQPQQFNQTVGLIEVPVTLQSANTLATQLRSKPGGRLTVEILGEDATPPTVAWMSPTEGQLLNTTAVAAAVQLTDDLAGLDPASLALTLDGASVRDAFTPLAAPTLEATLAAALTPAEGLHTLAAAVQDRAGQPANAAVTFTVDVTSPVITDLVPADGATVEVPRPAISASFSDALSGIDVASVRLLLDGTDVTAQAAVTAASVAFTPPADLPDGAHTVSVSVADLAGTAANAQATFDVQTIHPPPILPTSGFIHGQVFDAHGHPLAEATITVRGVTGEVRSGPDGRYQFPTPGSGEVLVNIAKAGFTSVQRKVEALATRDVAVEPAFLTPLDPAITPITRDAGGIATSSSGDDQVEFPPGAAPHNLQVRITPLHHEEQLPGPLPKGMAHIDGVFFEPRFTTFDKPATWRHHNHKGLPPGTKITLVLWDEANHTWLDAGQGQVTPDGQWMEFPILRSSAGTNVCCPRRHRLARRVPMWKTSTRPPLRPRILTRPVRSPRALPSVPNQGTS